MSLPHTDAECQICRTDRAIMGQIEEVHGHNPTAPLRLRAWACPVPVASVMGRLTPRPATIYYATDAVDLSPFGCQRAPGLDEPCPSPLAQGNAGPYGWLILDRSPGSPANPHGWGPLHGPTCDACAARRPVELDGQPMLNFADWAHSQLRAILVAGFGAEKLHHTIPALMALRDAAAKLLPGKETP